MSHYEPGTIITCIIDGIECQVEAGTTILDACKTIGIDIPTLCYLKDLAPDGSCRMCVVEVKGGRKGGMVTACTEHCGNGMEVYTRSQKVIDSRKFVLDLLLSNHKTDCFKCAKNGGCKLQEYCFEYGIAETSFKGACIDRKPDTSNPFFEFNPQLCIMCRKCTRVCQHLQGRDTISINGRGFETRMSPSYELPWRESNCESCGNCVSNCPTGALSSKDNKYGYKVWEVHKVRTTCPHCAVGCQIDLLVKNNTIVGVEPADGPSNMGLLCVKGKFGSYKFVGSGERLTTPLIKKNGKFETATWDEALDLIAEKFKQIKNEYGSDSIAGSSCSRSPNEDNFVFQKMMRTAFGTNNVDNCARVCHSASVHGLAITLGSGAMTNPIKDITEDVDMMLIVGSNPTEAHPVVGSRIRQAVQKGTKLVVVDPRKIDLVDSAEIHLPIKPGTNVAFANGMIHIILKEGLADTEFIKARTEGFEVLAEIVKDYTPEKVSEICHIDKQQLIRAAKMYAKAKKAPIIYCLGVTEHSTGTEGVMSLSNLAMVVGKLGKSGCGINPLRGQNNVQGACDMGCMPSDFPGYQKIANDEVRAKFEKAWGIRLNKVAGKTITDTFPAAIDGTIRGMYIFGEDPVVTDPDTHHIKEALEKLDFLVVQELFMTETAAFADVVLPGTAYAEKDGTFSNTERRIQRIRKAVEAPGEARLDTDIFCDVMTRMGYPCNYNSVAEIMEEIASLVPIFGGISFNRLDLGESLQWPCWNNQHKGTYIMHEGEFSRGLGYFYPVRYKESAEVPDEYYPFIMMTGRMLYHYNTRSMTGKTKGINELANRSYIEINEFDAKNMGIKDGDKVQVSSRRGKIETYAAVGDRVGKNEVFMTFHFPDGNPNHIANNALDNIARIPEYKVTAVQIKKI